MHSWRALGPIAVLVVVLPHCGTTYGSEGPEPAGQNDEPRDGGQGSADAASPTTPTTPTAPATGNCGQTQTSCDFEQAQCCITLVGTDSAAARTYGGSSATCMEIGGPNCGSLLSVAEDFTIKFPQRCAGPADCGSDVCCVLPAFGGDRFSKMIGSIECVAADDCKEKGRTLCADKSDCAPTENCLPETDPILSHVYTTFCR